MIRPNCRTCEHWASQSPKLPAGMGFCRINPPTVVVVENDVRTVWPITSGHVRCSLHQVVSELDAAERDREIAWRLHRELPSLQLDRRPEPEQG